MGIRARCIYGGRGANPTLSAMLLKINKLTEFLSPLSEPLSSLE